MRTEHRQRDSGDNRLSTIPGTLSDFTRDATRGWAIRVDLTYGTLFARTAPSEGADVLVLGSGGGFVERRTMSKEHLTRFVQDAATDDPVVRHGPEDSVWPSKFLEGVKHGQ